MSDRNIKDTTGLADALSDIRIKMDATDATLRTDLVYITDYYNSRIKQLEEENSHLRRIVSLAKNCAGAIRAAANIFDNS